MHIIMLGRHCKKELKLMFMVHLLKVINISLVIISLELKKN